MVEGYRIVMRNDDEKICNAIKKRIQYQLNHSWVGVLNSSQKDFFLNNFSYDDQIIGYILLDMLLLQNHEQEKQLVKSLIRKFKSSIYNNLRITKNQNSTEIESVILLEMEKTCFIPVTDKNPSDSSNAWTSIIREQVGMSDCFYDMSKIPLLLALNKKYIVFFDDMLGSGNQFDTFLSEKKYYINEKRRVSIWELLSINEQKVYYLCLAGYKEGIDMIKEKYNGIEIIEAEFFDEDDNILSENNEYWAYYDDEFRDRMINRIKEILEEKGIEVPFTRNLSVIFERNRPSNTVFPLYWEKKDNWAPIKAREGD